MKIFDEIIVANIQKELFTNKINCFLSKNKIQCYQYDNKQEIQMIFYSMFIVHGVFS